MKTEFMSNKLTQNSLNQILYAIGIAFFLFSTAACQNLSSQKTEIINLLYNCQVDTPASVKSESINKLAEFGIISAPYLIGCVNGSYPLELKSKLAQSNSLILAEKAIKKVDIRSCSQDALNLMGKEIVPLLIDSIMKNYSFILLQILANKHDPSASPFFLKTISDSSSGCLNRTIAAEALGEIHELKAIPLLIDAISANYDTLFERECPDGFSDPLRRLSGKSFGFKKVKRNLIHKWGQKDTIEFLFAPLPEEKEADIKQWWDWWNSKDSLNARN